jgi:hypothetical protein
MVTHSMKCMQHTFRNSVLLAAISIEYDSKWWDTGWLVAGCTLKFTFIRVCHHIGSTDRLRHVDTS